MRPHYNIARIGLHHYEEPPLSTGGGSGTIFFSGCMLKCIFCQNYDISHRNKGIIIDEDTLIDAMCYLQDIGANNINLVTPSHFVKCLIKTLPLAKPKLHIPIVYNTSGYEKVEDIRQLDGLVDIFLPDLKYHDDNLANSYSNVSNYFARATASIEEMYRQQSTNVFVDGLLKRGLIVRHLVLPSHLEDTKKVLDYLATLSKDIYLSLMGQYFPPRELPRPLNRRLTKGEYNSAVEYMQNIGLHNGWTQELSSATSEYVPSFDLELLREQLQCIKKV